MGGAQVSLMLESPKVALSGLEAMDAASGTIVGVLTAVAIRAYAVMLDFLLLC